MKSRAQRRREERLERKQQKYKSYNEAVQDGIQKHIKETQCPCEGSASIEISETERGLVCLTCEKELGVLERGPTFDNPIDAIEYMEQLMQEPDAEWIIDDNIFILDENGKLKEK